MLAVVALTFAAALQVETPVIRPDDGSILLWVAASPKTCSLKVASRVQFEAFARRPEDWAGKCIALSGYWHGRALFQSSADARTKYSQLSDELEDRRVGLYGRKEVLADAPDPPRQFVAVGLANTCEQLSNGSMMVMGYCHYTSGPIIVLAEIHRR